MERSVIQCVFLTPGQEQGNLLQSFKLYLLVSFIHSLNKCLFSAYSVPGTVPGTRNKAGAICYNLCPGGAICRAPIAVCDEDVTCMQVRDACNLDVPVATFRYVKKKNFNTVYQNITILIYKAIF